LSAYVIRRLLQAIPTMIGITIIVFLLFNVVAQDPAEALAGPKASPEKVAQLRAELGTDRPKIVQYFDFLRETFTLDFGTSWSDKRRVSDRLMEGLGPSLTVTMPAFLLALFFSVSLSLFCAYFRDSIADRTTVILAVAGMSISSLAYIIFGQYFVAYEWNLLPIFGHEFGIRGIAFLVLPWVIWIILTIGSEVRFFRTAMLEEMQQDYVRTAASKGLSTRRILFKHVLKNAMIPVITRVIITIPFLFVGSLLLEKFFGIPGLGDMSIRALVENDFPVIKAMVVFGAILYILFNLLSDILYAVVDPRVRLK
jgi:peptide/nickel transport system permease protein